MRTFSVKSQKEEVKEDVVTKESISNKVEDLNAGKVFIGVTKLGNKYQLGEKIIEEITYKSDNFNLSEENNRFISKEAKSFTVSFAKSIKDAKLLTLSKSNHEISLALKNNKRSFRRDGMCECSNNEVLYKNIEEGIDLKYLCNEGGIKESLIINNKQENYDFDFELNIKDLTPKFNKETNRLELQKDGNTIYTILSPYMIDGNNKRSDDCYYEISQESEILTLNLRVNSEWVNASDRVFPVVIDPTIKVMNDNIFHMHTSKDLLNDEPCSMKEKTLYSFIESNVNGEVFLQNVYANVRCDKISPSLRKLVNKANITLNILSISGDYSFVGLKVIKNDELIKTVSGNKTLTKIEIDVTKEVKNGNNVNIELVMEQKKSTVSYYTKYVFYTPLADAPNNSYLLLEYNEKDIINTKEYTLGMGETTGVNVKNGTFIQEIPLTNVAHNSLNLGVSAIFDSKDYDGNVNHFMSKGWRTNLHQFLVKSNDYDVINGCKDVTYIDEQGNKHILHESWYYLDDNLEKVYVNRKDVFIDSDKKLKVYVNDIAQEVKYDVKNDEGLSFVSGSSLSEYISKADLKATQVFKLEYANNQKEYYELQEDGDIIGKVYCYFDESRLDEICIPFESVKFKNGVAYCSFNEKLTIYLTQKHFKLRCDSEGYYFVNEDLSNTTERIKEDHVKYDVNQQFENIYLNEDIQNVETQIKNLEVTVKSGFLSLKEINNSLENISMQFGIVKLLDSQKLSMMYDNAILDYYTETGIGTFSNTGVVDKLANETNIFRKSDKGYYVYNEISQISDKCQEVNSVITAQLKLINDKIQFVSSTIKELYQKNGKPLDYENAKLQLSVCEEKLQIYQKVYFDSVEQLKQLKEYRLALIEEQKKQVNDFIVDENGNTLGFDGYGRLILVTDAYENKIEITYGYDKDNKDELLSISSETQNIRFEYSKNKQLKYIYDNDGNKISFSYDNELDYITTPSNSYSFDYTKYFKVSTNLLESIEISKTDKDNLFVETRITQDKEIGENTEDVNQETTVDIYHHYKFDTNKTYIYDVIDEKNETLIETIWFDLAGRIIKDETNELITLTRYEDDKLITSTIIKTTPKVYKEISLASDTTTLSEEYDLKTDNAFIKDGVSLLPSNYSLGLLLKLKNVNSVKIKPINLTISAIKESGSTLERYSYNNPECYSDLLILPILIRTEARKLKIEGTIRNSSINVESIKLIALEDYETYEYNKDCVTLSIKNGCISSCRSSSKYPPYKTKRNVYGDIVRENYTYDSNNRLTSIIDSDGNVTEYYYDNNGKCIEQRSYNSYDASLMKIKKVIYDEKGRVINTLGQIKDEKGNYPTREITYLPNSNVIAKVKDYNNENTCYTYDFKTKELLSISSGINGVNNATTYGYKYGLLTSLSHHGLKINYEYDGKRRKTKVLVNGEKTIWYSYVDKMTSKEKDITDGSYVTMNTKDGYFVGNYLDNDGTIKKSLYSSDFSSGEQTNTYNADNQLIKVESIIRYRNDESTVRKEVVNYTYESNNLVKLIKTIDDNVQLTITNSYDSNNRFVETSNYAFDNTSYNYEFIRNDKHQLKEIIIKDSNNTNIINTKYEFDALNRINHQLVKLGKVEICNEYNYLKQDENSLDLISEDVTKVKINNNGVISYGLDTNSYKYDVNGNIISIINDDYQIRYQYDKCNRLIREDNSLINKTITYKYDNSGNILLKKSYAYSEDEVLHNPKVDEYIYDCENGLDRLLRYNDLEIAYDTTGRPITYKGNKLTWNSNGELLTYKDGSGTINYTYDINSIRTKKVFNGETHNYVVNGTQILQEKIVEGTSTTIINYHYILNKLVGFTYNDGEEKNYIYRRNIQGDIIGIYDSLGNEVGGYAYDSYGKCYIRYKENSSDKEKTILNINPFRYRGYYYDNETGLYYLNARYYDPEIGRFISPDVLSILDETKGQINGLNLYAYCRNNSVMGYDPYGTFDLWEFVRGVANIVTGVLAIGVGVIVLIGGAPIGMLIVAGITVGAGVLTLNNGVADTIGSFVGYNYMSDGLFNGNTTAYNWYSGITSIIAGIGTAICGNFIKTEYFMRGATPGTEGKMTLQPGMELDRYGSEYGRFLTNPGTAPGQLNLPASNNLVLNHYKVLKSFKVSTGIVDGGGGFQYFTWKSVHRLIQMGYLAII